MSDIATQPYTAAHCPTVEQLTSLCLAHLLFTGGAATCSYDTERREELVGRAQALMEIPNATRQELWRVHAEVPAAYPNMLPSEMPLAIQHVLKALNSS